MWQLIVCWKPYSGPCLAVGPYYCESDVEICHFIICDIFNFLLLNIFLNFQPKVVSDTDEAELARQLEELEAKNREVGGDDDQDSFDDASEDDEEKEEKED